MARADLTSPRRTRLGVTVLVLLLHLGVVLALIRAFAPEFTASVTRGVTEAFTVTITSPPPEPEPEPVPAPAAAAEPAGAAAPAGRKAAAREVAVPRPRIVVASPSPAPRAAGKGDEAASGAHDAGDGNGAGGQGAGTGSGTGGDGQGGGGASRAVKLSGDINSARDYPRASRALRLGDHVVVALTVGTDGRVRNCRIHRPSRDPEADRVTCRLASERFRFRPATDARGNAIESTFGWQQRWFGPQEKD